MLRLRTGPTDATILRPALQSRSFDIEATSVIENWRGFADAGSPIRLDCGPIESEWRESGSPILGSVLIVACWTIPFIAVDGLSGT
jgi:hypothetical protein